MKPLGKECSYQRKDTATLISKTRARDEKCRAEVQLSYGESAPHAIENSSRKTASAWSASNVSIAATMNILFDRERPQGILTRKTQPFDLDGERPF
jgi:hypothetical protein